MEDGGDLSASSLLGGYGGRENAFIEGYTCV